MFSRDQMVGPWQVPVADVAVTLMGFNTYRGEAFAMGERTPLAVTNAPASGRMAVGEAITNIAAASIANIGDIKPLEVPIEFFLRLGYFGPDVMNKDAVTAWTKAWAAREFGAKVTAITVSKEQLAFAQARIQREGLADRVEAV